MHRAPKACDFAMNDQVSHEYALTCDQIQVMLHQEETLYACFSNYTRRNENIPENTPVISEAWRQKICEWAFEVVDHFDYDRDIVSQTINYLDRYVSYSADKGVYISRKEFQLAAVACLYIATKMEGSHRSFQRQTPPLTISTLVELGRGIFSHKAIELMERRVLAVLGWRMHPPTSFRFILHFMKLLNNSERRKLLPKAITDSMHDASRYLSELAVCVSSLSIECKPSTIAIASLLNAMECANPDYLNWEVRDSFLQEVSKVTNICTESDELLSARAALKSMCPAMPTAEHNDVRECMESGSSSPVCVSGSTSTHTNRKRNFAST
uniref:Cyclin-like domain-containing protein n=1 Tax=Ditylum brightwellii TaxID=49249 RepID=A0A6U3QJV8_9STRA